MADIRDCPVKPILLYINRTTKSCMANANKLVNANPINNSSMFVSDSFFITFSMFKMTDLILSITLHEGNTCSADYIELLNRVVRETLSILCTEDDPRDMCNGVVDSTISKTPDNNILIEWTTSSLPLITTQEDRRVFMKNLDCVPTNVTCIDNEMTLHKNVCKHKYLNIWWRCSGQTEIEHMNGIYVETTWDLEPELERDLGIVKCNCIERCPGLHIYHIPQDLLMVDLIRTNKYVTLFASAIMKCHDNTNYDILRTGLDELNKLDDSPLSHTRFYLVNTLKEAIQVRVYLSSKDVPSVILQEFNGTYLVYYHHEDPNLNTSLKPEGLRSLEELDDEVLFDITPNIIGWTSHDNLVGIN